MDTMTDALKTYRYEEITGNLDLDERARDRTQADAPGGRTYLITIYDADGITAEAETAYAVHYEEDGRLGIAWGGEPTWADVDSLDSGIEVWLNDGEEWERRN